MAAPAAHCHISSRAAKAIAAPHPHGPAIAMHLALALTSSHQRRIPANVAVGMAQLGPAMTFETVGKILLVGLCGLTHYKRLEMLATFAITTVIVDFLIFMR